MLGAQTQRHKIDEYSRTRGKVLARGISGVEFYFVTCVRRQQLNESPVVYHLGIIGRKRSSYRGFYLLALLPKRPAINDMSSPYVKDAAVQVQIRGS